MNQCLSHLPDCKTLPNHHDSDLRRLRPAWPSLSAVASLLLLASCTQAQPRLAMNPVEDLRGALLIDADPTKPEDLRARRQDLEQRAAAVQSVADLRRALGLQEWRDEDTDVNLAEIDRGVRQELTARLTKILRAALNSNDLATRMAAITAIGETGAAVRGAGTDPSIASPFLPDLARLVRMGSPEIQSAAAAALSRAAADPRASAQALAALLRESDVTHRRVGALALADMIRQVVQQARASNTSAIRTGRAEVVAVGQAVVTAAAPGLRDPDATVRGSCLEAVHIAAGMFGLGEIVPAPSAAAMRGTPGGRTEPPPPRVAAQERGDFLPLIEALARVTPEVARLLADSEPANRLVAAHALDDLSYARIRFLRRFGSIPGTGDAPPDRVPGLLVSQRRSRTPPESTGNDTTAPGDMLRTALVGVLPDLGRALHDSDLRVRLAAINTLEAMEQDAAPDVPDMIVALGDSDRFVRWATARTLGKLGPAKASGAVSGLAHLLEDGDVDVRVAACLALERFGPDAGPAVPALALALRRWGDADFHTAVARAIQAIGLAARPAVPALAAALSDDNARVRQAVAEALGRLGAAARPAIDALRLRLNDSNDEVRRAASDAILTINSLPAGR